MGVIRIAVWIAMCGVLAACQPTTTNVPDPFAMTRQPVPEPQFKNGKPTAPTDAPQPAAATGAKTIVSPNLSPKLNVVAVVVNAKDADKGFGASFSLDKARAGKIADEIITAHLEQFDNEAGVPVVVDVDLEMLYLAGGAAVLLGSTNSASRAKLGVYNTANSEILLGDIPISAAGSKRLPGLIGGAQVEGQEQEMAHVAAGLAEVIRKKMFGG